MSNPPAFKKFQTNQGEAVQCDPNSESTSATSADLGADTKRNPLNLLDLNDDCLREIFNIKRVSLLDLASVAQCCKRLKAVATDIFVRSHKVFDFKKLAVKDFGKADRLLRTFGTSITDLRIDFASYSLDGVEIIDAIRRHCSKLKSLTVKSYEIPDCPDVFDKIRLLFRSLTSLYIKEISLKGCEHCQSCRTATPNVVNFFRDCHSLMELRVVYCDDMEKAIFDSIFPRLEHFTCKDYPSERLCCVQSFIRCHRDLKTLILCPLVRIESTIETISSNCKKLRKLEFATNEKPQTYETAWQQLGNLKYLTELGIEWDGHNVDGALRKFQQSSSLRVLHLEEILGSWNMIPTIAQIQSLRVLKLYDIENLQNLRALQPLKQLEELFIENSYLYPIDSDLIDIIRDLVSLTKLKLSINDSEPPYRAYCISKQLYMQMVDVIERRPADKIRYIQIDCASIGDFKDSLRPSVEFTLLE